MFPSLRPQETFVVEARFASREGKMFVNLLRTILLLQQMFPRLRPQETFVAEARFASREGKMFVNLLRTILLLQQMFPRLRAKGKFRETMFPYTTFPRFREPNQGQSV